ncbi:hypothetical protein [Rickettsiella endosymbiont of Miltochrista miniata]|uniref:hypothetical protein n=1 Tax=Rickettsiella endosymbiont of Miltochrista miniata TaxID=3066239 RepID=UPI00313C2896
MMDNNFSDQELPETSFEFSNLNQNNIIISYGPKNGFLWRGEAFDKQQNLIECLNNVFTYGFTQRDEQSVLANLPYIKRYPDFICASNTYCCNNDEFTGLEQEQLAAGTYGYIYLIDTSKKNIQSIPLCEENLLNENFVAGYTEEINEGPDYAIISKVDPKCIIGAMPSAFVAFALGINEKSFIKNPAYKEIFCCEKIKEIIGGEFLLIAPGRLRLSHDLPVSEVYQRYLQADEMAAQSRSSSTATNANMVSATFFQGQPQLPESTSTDPNAQGSYQCRR